MRDPFPAPLRIALTSYRTHPYVGGQGVYVSALAEALNDLGHHVTVISGPPYPNLPANVKLVELPSLDLFARKNALLALHPNMMWRQADRAEWLAHNTGAFGELNSFGLRLRQWLASRRDDFDVIHDNQGLSRPMLSLQREGWPLLTTVHHPISVDLRAALGAEPSAWKRFWLRRWHSFIATQARVARALPHVLTVSHASRQALASDFRLDPDKVTVCPNGVDVSVFQPRPNTPREAGLIVSTASADTPLKGLHVLIAALGRLRDRVPTARAVVIGSLREGPAKRALKEAGLADRVSFTGGVDRTDVAELFARADIAVFPSLFEGFGLPAAEAMACGAPVIVSDGGALPEVVGEAGLVTPAGNDEALADTIASLLADPQRREALGRAGAQRARTEFSWTRHAHAALALYHRLGVRAHRRA